MPVIPPVQGGAEMGRILDGVSRGKPIKCRNAAALSQLYGFPVPDTPASRGSEMVEACARGETGLLYCLGGISCAHCRNRSTSARHCQRPLRVHQDIILTDRCLSPLATR